MSRLSPFQTLAILSWGGIGDTLRNLSLIPHEAIFQKTGWRIPVLHQPWQEIGCRADALPPNPAVIQDLVERCPSLRWEGVGTLGLCAKVSNRLLREVLKISHNGRSLLIPFSIKLSTEEASAIGPKNALCLQVGIQTHLMGMPSKKWSVSKWKVFLSLLRQHWPLADFHLFEPSAEVKHLCLDAGFYSYPHFNLAQSIMLARQMDYVISVDSWMKYVAAMDRIPQSIIIPDQRSDYEKLTSQSLLRYEFAALIHCEEVTLIGLNPKSRTLDLPIMSEVDPQTLFNRMLPSLLKNYSPG